MPIEKNSININFAQGLDQKSDPWQVAPGKFLALSNIGFNKGGLLQKRNGFAPLTPLPSTSYTHLTTFNGDLVAIGSMLTALSETSSTWVEQGPLQPVQVAVLPLIRNSLNQSQADSATSNGLVCTVYTESDGTTTTYKYAVADKATGQNLIEPTILAAAGPSRVFALGNYFVIVLDTVVSAQHHLEVISINTHTLVVSPQTTISLSYAPASTMALDGVVANNNLYLAWCGLGGATVRMTYLDSNVIQHNTIVLDPARGATIMSLSADISGSTPNIYVTYYTGTALYTSVVNQAMSVVLAPTLVKTVASVVALTATADNDRSDIVYEINANYSYVAVPTHHLDKTAITEGGVVTASSTVVRSVGLASKAFLLNGSTYFLTAYQSSFQPSYFLSDLNGKVLAKLAYSNGGGYVNTGLPSATVINSGVDIAYLIKDLVQAVNREQGAATSAGIYSQTGINLSTLTLTTDGLNTAEIGRDLHLSGGFLWSYDGYLPTEQGFFLWPEPILATGSIGAGTMSQQLYYYQVVYEWSDNQGNLFRSAPSIPFGVALTGTQNTVTLNIPTLRLTYKIANPVKVTIYRWSTNQQSYYQVTSVSKPLLNDPTVDSIQFVDTLPDASIIGNSLIYTTGGVIENISAPAVNDMALWDSRLWVLNAEDPDELWFSKTLVKGAPVEMSDLLTYYIPPAIGTSGSVGPNKAIHAMDDKLVVFKPNAILYINGAGPDNAGGNNQYSQAILVTSTVGCSNPNSIIFTPAGLMFESNKGIWLLGRNLSTQYIGAPVEDLTTGATVKSALTIPGTNQVRFTLSSGVTLVYDYFYGQWGSFTGIPGISSTIYDGLHTYINSYGESYKERPSTFLDGSKPVLMSFTTSWLGLAGLQGYERLYFIYLLGKYYTPFKLNVEISYDYNDPATQAVVVTPDNRSDRWGSDSVYGGGEVWGGPGNVFEARVFPQKQKCESFKLTVTEVFDSTLGVTAGAGLTLSGLNIVVGAKKRYRTNKASQNFG
jgi:hypothetical protein